MTFANTLSIRFLIMSSALLVSTLSTTGCKQPLPGQFKNGAAGNAAAAGATGAKTQTQKTATGTNANAAGNNAANGGDPAANGNGTASAAAGAQATTAVGAAGAAAAANSAKAVPACAGKADEFACDERTLYHCVNGAYEGKPLSCKNAAQCAAGLTTGQCGECDPGTFLCDDVQLQRCDETGAYVMEAECASAKLCKAETGICDTQVCHEDEYHCEGDQLQTCKTDLSDWQNSGAACDPGLCSAKEQGCLECLPDSPVTCADEQSLMSCTADGMLAQMPCPSATPFCGEGKCVQCNMPTDCGEAMNDCGTLTCTAGMCVPGDPKPKGTACSSNGGKMCDYLGSCVVCVTDLDCNDSTKRCYLGTQCAPKDAITATPLLSSWSVTVSPGFRANISATGAASQLKVNGALSTKALDSSNVIDASYLLSIDGYSACGLIQTASQNGSTINLNFSNDMETAMSSTGFPSCLTTVTLTAAATSPTP